METRKQLAQCDAQIELNARITRSCEATRLEVKALPDDTTLDQFAALDITFDLTHSTNDEIAFAWFMKSIDAGYEPAFPEIRKFLLRVGRGKFIFRLYSELVNEGRKVWAQEVYAEARPGYHPVTQQRLDETLK